ncbi:hypothetical protein EV361DRAFT_950275 [Lentinula raphanica]|nr:hypothetical protein EV361DRAFT_950275 [Lentinula raphanica]
MRLIVLYLALGSLLSTVHSKPVPGRRLDSIQEQELGGGETLSFECSKDSCRRQAVSGAARTFTWRGALEASYRSSQISATTISTYMVHHRSTFPVGPLWPLTMRTLMKHVFTVAEAAHHLYLHGVPPLDPSGASALTSQYRHWHGIGTAEYPNLGLDSDVGGEN